MCRRAVQRSWGDDTRKKVPDTFSALEFIIMEYVFRLSLLSVCYWSVTLLWLGEFWRFPSQHRGSQPDFGWIVSALLLSFVATGIFYTLQWGNVTGQGQDLWRWCGTGLYGIGVVLRYWAASTLGTCFSRHVHVTAQQPLVSHGPYRRWRHPLYLGLWLIAIGMNSLMANVPGCLVALALNSWVLIRRARREEEALEIVLGERYRLWKAARCWI